MKKICNPFVTSCPPQQALRLTKKKTIMWPSHQVGRDKTTSRRFLIKKKLYNSFLRDCELSVKTTRLKQNKGRSTCAASDAFPRAFYPSTKPLLQPCSSPLPDGLGEETNVYLNASLAAHVLRPRGRVKFLFRAPLFWNSFRRVQPTPLVTDQWTT